MCVNFYFWQQTYMSLSLCHSSAGKHYIKEFCTTKPVTLENPHLFVQVKLNKQQENRGNKLLKQKEMRCSWKRKDPECTALCLTLEEVGEVVERSVVWVSVPFLQSHAVKGLQAERLPFTVHHDHLTGVPVQTWHVLKKTQVNQAGPQLWVIPTWKWLKDLKHWAGCWFSCR